MNHTKIIIVSHKDGAKTTILDTSAGVKGNVPAGLPLCETADGALDTFTFTVKGMPTRKLFEEGDFVYYTVNDGSEKTYLFTVLSDNARTLSRETHTYDHTVTAIEATKLLEKIKIFQIALTNVNDSLYRQFEKLTINAELLTEGKDPRVICTDALKAFLETQPSRDFYFPDTDLRTAIDTMLLKYDMRCTVESVHFSGKDVSQIVVGARSMRAVRAVSPEWTAQSAGKIVGEELSNDLQDSAGKICARGFNTVSSTVLTVTDIFKSSSETLNDSNAMAMLPFPVSDRGFESFVIHANVMYKEEIGLSFHLKLRERLAVDIASRFIPVEQYECLSELDKQKYLPYSVGTTQLTSPLKANAWGWQSAQITDIIVEMAEEQFPDSESGYHADSLSGLWYECIFTAKYYPLLNTVVELSKPGVYDRDKLRMGIYDAQSEQVLDLERHGKRLEGLISRTGNDAYYIDVRADKFSTLLPLMSKIDIQADGAGHSDNGYVVYKRETAIYDTFVNCRYYLSKNFHAITSSSGVDRERHLFDIPLESQDCPILVKKYMVFGRKARVCANGGLAFSALNTLIGEKGGKINSLLFQTTDAKGLTYPQNTEKSDGKTPYKGNADYYFMRPLVAYGQAKTMNFVAATLDNYSVDYSRDGYVFSLWGDGGHKITYNRYVSNAPETAGECGYFNLWFASDTLEHQVATFPIVDQTNGDDGAKVGALSYFSVHYEKDRTQRPIFQLSLECVPAEEDFGSLFIGSAFCRDNNLVCDNGDGLTVTMDGETFKGLLFVYSTNKLLDGSDTIDVAAFIRPGGRTLASELFEVKVDGANGGYARLKWQGSPKKYKTELECLESTGTQWIDTGETINTATDEVELVFQCKESAVYKWFFGEHDNNARFGLGTGDGVNKRNVAYGNTTYKVTDTQIYGNRHVFVANKDGVFIDGVKIGAYSSFSSTSTLYLFNLNLSGGNYSASAVIWSYKHTRNGGIIRDLIPVLDINGVACFYDKVSGQFFYNQGTGAFICGASIDQKIASWALVNEWGEIYLGANGEPCDIYVCAEDFPE